MCIRDSYKGGTILKTCRCPEFVEKEGQLQAVRVCEAFDIEGIIVIGGDGSMRGAGALSALGVNTVTLPGTIDNDLAYTDFTIGFDTAVNGVIEEMSKVNDTMISHDRIGVVEVMGNKCGDIALYSALAAGANFLILPEAPFDLDEICSELVKARLKGRFSSMIVVSEGAAHAADVAKYIGEKTGFDTKSVVLGYTQPVSYTHLLGQMVSVYHSQRQGHDRIGETPPAGSKHQGLCSGH